jgi:hypothetical protein
MISRGPKGQQAANLVYGKAELARAANEGKCARLCWPIDPMTTPGAERDGQHLDFLVVTDRLDIDARQTRQLANRYPLRCLRSRSRDLAHGRMSLIL